MTWRTWRWWLTGLVVYLIFLAAMLPAAYASSWLQRKIPQIQLAGVTGSVWFGVAREAVYSGDPWGQLQWHFDWAGLFRGHPGYRLTLQGPGTQLSGRVAGNPQHLLLRDLHGQLDIQRLAPWLPLPSGAASGELQLRLDRVVLVQERPTAAEGVIALTQLTLGWPQPLVLGSYQLKLVTRPDAGIEGTLLDTSGPLALQGNLQLQPDGHYEVSGTLSARDSSNQALDNLLRYLPADVSGGHRFNISGQWQ